MTIATNEPTELRAGDLWQWRREDLTGDYPAPVWTLKYRFKNAAGGFEVIASSDGQAFAVSFDSAAVIAGTYSWVARAESGAIFHSVDSGVMEVLPNLFSGSAATASDQRTHEQIVLEAIEAVLENRATKDQEEYTIGNRSLKRTPMKDLVWLRETYRARVWAQQRGPSQYVARF
jgi:hypothetical protein